MYDNWCGVNFVHHNLAKESFLGFNKVELVGKVMACKVQCD